MPRKILLNLLTHLLLVGSVEGGEHLFRLSLLLALVPHHRDLVLQHLQSISYVYDLIWLKHFYLFVLRKENSPCSPPQSSEQAGKECRSSHWEKKKFQKNCKTDLCHILLADTFVLWTYLSDMIKFEFASTWWKCSRTISATSPARSTPRTHHQQPFQKNRPRRPNPA